MVSFRRMPPVRRTHQDVIEKIQQAVDAKADKGSKNAPADNSQDGEEVDELLPPPWRWCWRQARRPCPCSSGGEAGIFPGGAAGGSDGGAGYVGPFEGSSPGSCSSRERSGRSCKWRGAAPEPVRPADPYGRSVTCSSHDALNKKRDGGKPLSFCRKPLAGRVVQKRLLPMKKNKTPLL